MADWWEFAVCDEHGDMHPMTERMARAMVAGAGEQEWTVWRRRVQIGDWYQAEAADR